MAALMSHRTIDVLVVGGGPAGLYAGEQFARRGLHTVVCEEHGAIGDPVHCTGVLASESFGEMDLPDEATINAVASAHFVSPSGMTVSYTPASPIAKVIDRPAFDRALADRARRAGVELRMGVRVSHIETGAAEAGAQVGDQWTRARLLVLACGANYAWQRRLGLGLPRLYLHTAQRELPAKRLGDVEVYVGRDVAPDGFAWAVPVARHDGPHVRVGVMTSHDAPTYYERAVARLAGRWGIGEVAPPRQKILPLGAIDRTYADRLLVVGDAAGLVKPTTGGGIHYSIVSASIAARIGIEALECDSLDRASLSRYERAWKAELAAEFEAQHALRAIVTRFTDQELDALFELAKTDGIMPIVRSTAKFNRHRDLILALFRHPPARRILFRALGG
jgi:geranylgeranyl reductase family protein